MQDIVQYHIRSTFMLQMLRENVAAMVSYSCYIEDAANMWSASQEEWQYNSRAAIIWLVDYQTNDINMQIKHLVLLSNE